MRIMRLLLVVPILVVGWFVVSNYVLSGDKDMSPQVAGQVVSAQAVAQQEADVPAPVVAPTTVAAPQDLAAEVVGEPSLLLEPQVNDENRVAVEVRPLEGFPAEDTWVFSISLNTHSVALDGDLMEISVLRDESGQEYVPLAWEGSPPGGHHRNGQLAFEAPSERYGRWELVIRDVAQVPERVFAWELPDSQM
jgi:hypothetical protein